MYLAVWKDDFCPSPAVHVTEVSRADASALNRDSLNLSHKVGKV